MTRANLTGQVLTGFGQHRRTVEVRRTDRFAPRSRADFGPPGGARNPGGPGINHLRGTATAWAATLAACLVSFHR